jgi:hypothetical protein
MGQTFDPDIISSFPHFSHGSLAGLDIPNLV